MTMNGEQSHKRVYVARLENLVFTGMGSSDGGCSRFWAPV